MSQKFNISGKTQTMKDGRSNQNQMKPRKITIFVIAGVLALPLVWNWSASIFISEKWKKSFLSNSSSVPSATIRINMVDDLLRRYKLVGMTRTEIEQLLGKPPSTQYFPSYDYVYWLGPERGFISIDSEWL